MKIGYKDGTSVASIIEDLRDEHGRRLYEQITSARDNKKPSIGRLPLTDILMRHDYIQRFQSKKEIVEFLESRSYTGLNESCQNLLLTILRD